MVRNAGARALKPLTERGLTEGHALRAAGGMDCICRHATKATRGRSTWAAMCQWAFTAVPALLVDTR